MIELEGEANKDVSGDGTTNAATSQTKDKLQRMFRSMTIEELAQIAYQISKQPNLRGLHPDVQPLDLKWA